MTARHHPRAPRPSAVLVWALAILIWVCSPVAAPAAGAQAPVYRLDGLAALVGGRAPGPDVDAILLSDVELRARLALSGQQSGPLPLGPLPPALLAATLNQLIGEVLIAREAERVRATQPGSLEVSRERQRLISSAGGRSRMLAILEALSAPEREVDEIARRRASVAAFLQANLEGTTTITEAEVERHYQALQESGDPAAVKGPPDAVRARLRDQLARQALDSAISRWMTALRGRTFVRLLAPYAEDE
jgi:hypothetical protein